MRIFIYITMLVFASSYLHAQDTIYKADSSVQIVKILEVNETQVKYKLFTNLDGPTYVIGKEYVSLIVYENGSEETFPKSIPDHSIAAPKIDPRTHDFGRNFISLNVYDLLVLNTLTFGYEHTSKSGLIGFKIPLSFALNKKDIYRENKVFGTGLDLNLYPYGQGQAKFFYGPSFEYKKFTTYYQYNDINSAYALLFQAGFLFQPTKQLNFSINAGIGYARLFKSEYNTGEVASRVGVNMGFKF